MIQAKDIMQALSQVQDPELKKDIVSLKFIRDVDIHDHRVVVHFQPDTPACPLLNQIKMSIESAVRMVEGVEQVDVIIESGEAPKPEPGDHPFGNVESLNKIEKVVAVMSGKGGVGKSLVTGLTATSLRKKGYRVGILDADITGPSIPRMFFADRPEVQYSPMAVIPPVSAAGIKIMSINLLLKNEEDAVIWRGPLVGRAIRQFWTDTLWGDLDYLIVDLPPGTSDAPLTVMQSLPMSGVILVTSPQDLAGMVVRKAAHMVSQIGIPLLGLIENMSYFQAPDTGTCYEIFGPSHAKATAEALQIPLLGRLPIDSQIAILCDRGKAEDCQVAAYSAIVDWVVSNTPTCRPPIMPAS